MSFTAHMRSLLPSCYWDITLGYPYPIHQFLSKAYWDKLDATAISREHWKPISLDLSHNCHFRHTPKRVEFYDEIQKLTTVTSLRIRQLFHSVHLWDNLPPHWLSMRHLSLEFRHECPQIFFKYLSQMSQLEVLQLEFLVSPERNRIQLDLSTSLTTLSLGLPPLIPKNGCSLDRVGLGVMTGLQNLIVYAPKFGKIVQPDKTVPDWMYTLPQWTSLEKLEWHYISTHDFCALGPYLPTSLTDLMLTSHRDNNELDTAHYNKIYSHANQITQTNTLPRFDYPIRFNLDAMVGPLLKLPQLRTASLPKSLTVGEPSEDWLEWLSHSSFIKAPEFIWNYQGFPEMLPQMTSILELDLKTCLTSIYADKMLGILSQMTQLTRLRMWRYMPSANITLQKLRRLEELRTLYHLDRLEPDSPIWPDLKYVKVGSQASHPLQWPHLSSFLQHHTTLVELTLTLPFNIAANVQFWSVLSQLTLLTTLECTIKSGGDTTLTASELPPTLKSLFWVGCPLRIPETHLVLEMVELDDYSGIVSDIEAHCQRNCVRNRTLEEMLMLFDSDSLTWHWFDHLAIDC